MKRIAAPMVGGLATSFLMELIVYPVLYERWKSRGVPAMPPTDFNSDLQPVRRYALSGARHPSVRIDPAER
jgi:hypothetical protein